MVQILEKVIDDMVVGIAALRIQLPSSKATQEA